MKFSSGPRIQIRWESFLGERGPAYELTESSPINYYMENQLVLTARREGNTIVLYLAAPITNMSEDTMKAWITELERQKNV